MATPAQPTGNSVLQPVRQKLEEALAGFPRAEHPKIRQKFDEAFAGVTTAADLPKGARRFAALLDQTEKKWTRSFEATIKDPVQFADEVAESKRLLAPLRDVAKVAFRITPPKMDQMSRAERVATDISLGARRTGVGALGSNLLSKIPYVGEPFKSLYLPPGYQEDVATSGTAQGLGTVAELIAPGALAARVASIPTYLKAGMALTAPARGVMALGTAAGRAAAAARGATAGAPLTAATRAVNMALPAGGAGAALAGYYQGVQALPESRAIVGQVDPNTGEVTAERAPLPTPMEVAANIGLGGASGLSGGAVTGLVGPTAGALASRGRELLSGLAGMVPVMGYDVLTTGGFRPEALPGQIPGIVAGVLTAQPLPKSAFEVVPPGAVEVPPTPAAKVAMNELEAMAAGEAGEAAPAPAAPVVPGEPPAPPAASLPGDRMPTSMRPGTPNYKNRTLDFGSDVELALYLATASNKPAETRAKYWDWLQKTTGATKADLAKEGAALRQSLKDADAALPKGESIKVPTSVRDKFMAPPTPPAPQTAPKAPTAAPSVLGKLSKQRRAYVERLRRAVGGSLRGQQVPDEAAFLELVAKAIDKDLTEGNIKPPQTPEDLNELLSAYGLTPDEQTKIVSREPQAPTPPAPAESVVEQAARLFLANDTAGAVRLRKQSGLSENDFLAQMEAAIARIQAGGGTQAKGTFGPYKGPDVTYSPEAVAAKAQAALAGEVTPLGAEPPVVSPLAAPEPPVVSPLAAPDPPTREAYNANKAAFFNDSEMSGLMDRVRQQRMSEFGTEKELRQQVENLGEEPIDVNQLYTKGLTFFPDWITGSRKLALDISGITPPPDAENVARALGQKYLGADLRYDPRRNKLWVASLNGDEDVVLYLQEQARSGEMSLHDRAAAKELAEFINRLQQNQEQILKEFSSPETTVEDTFYGVQLPEPGELPPGARMVEGPDVQEAELVQPGEAIPSELPQSALERLRGLASRLEKKRLPGESSRDYRDRAAMGQFQPKEKTLEIELGGEKMPKAVAGGARFVGTRSKDPSKAAVLKIGLEDGSFLKVQSNPDPDGTHPWSRVSSAGTIGKGRISTKEYNGLRDAVKESGIQETTQAEVSQKMQEQAGRERAQLTSDDPEIKAAVARMQERLGKYLPAILAGGAMLHGGAAEAAQMLATGSSDLGLVGLAAAGGVLGVAHGLPLLTIGLRAVNSVPELVAAANSLVTTTGVPTARRSPPESITTQPQVQAALRGGPAAPESWAKAGAKKVISAASKATKPVQDFMTERNRLLRTVGEHALGKALSILDPSFQAGIDKDTLRSRTGMRLASFYEKGLAATVEISRRLVETIARVPEFKRTTVALDASGNPIIDPATGAPKRIPLRLPQTLMDFRKVMAQRVAAGEIAAADMEDYLIRTYDARTRELLEKVIESGGALPAPYASDPIIEAFVTKLPEMLNDLHALGLVGEDQVARADRFLIRTMTPGAPGFGGMLRNIVDSFRTTPDDPKRSMFWYGKGNVQNAMDPAVFAEYTRPWEFVSETSDQMVIRDAVTGQTKTVSKVFDPVTGEIEAANYLHRNPKFAKGSPQGFESPWMELDGAPAGRVRASRNWSSEELDGNGISRDLSTAVFKTLSYWTKAAVRGDLYDYISVGGGTLDGQRIAIPEADVPNPAQYFADKGGVENWSTPLRGRGYGKLQGHFVRKDVLDFIENTNQEGRLLQILEAAAREYKRTRTTLSVSYAVTNLLGNHGMLLLNGGTGADLPEALRILMDKSPEYREFARRGAYEGTTTQEMIRERQRAGTHYASVTESALSGIGKVIDKGTDAMVKQLVSSMGGKPMTAENLMAGLRDIAQTANPLVFNKFVDDLYRTALGVGVLREGGTMDGAAVRMREDMYNVMRPRTAAGRALTAAVFPWASWPIWALRNVPRVALQNWQTAAANLLTAAAMAAVNEALVFSDETDEQRKARRAAEEAAAFSHTNIGFPARAYLSKDVSIRLGSANPFETFQQLGDTAKRFAETGDVGEAARLFPFRPSGPLPGVATALQGKNPLRPSQPLPDTPEGLAALGVEATYPSATNLVRGIMNRRLAEEDTDASGGEIPVGPTSQILRALGPLDVRDVGRDIKNQRAAMKRIDFEINRQKATERRKLDPNSGQRITREEYRKSIERLEKKRKVLKEIHRRRIKALADYQSMQRP